MKQADTKGSFTLSPQRLKKAARNIARMVPFNDGGWLEPHGHNFPEQYTESEQTKIRAIALAAISVYLGDTHVDVPREPTEAMVDAAYESFGCHEIFRVEEIQPGDLYRAMLSAELTERDAG